MKPYVTNAANETQVKEAGQKETRVRNTHYEDVKWVLSSQAGRRVLHKYLMDAGILVTSFNNSGSITAFNEGQRNMGLKLLADIEEADPEMYTLMRQEYKRSQV